MGKFIIIQDMRSLPCYRNVNARLLYMHVAMGCDISTYTYATSLRRLAMDLDMTVDAIRHALKVLIRDGLLAAETAPQGAPHGAPHGAPQSAPQRAPHLTILKIIKNGTPNGTPNTTPNTIPNTTPSTTEDTTDKNIKYINIEKILTHASHVREWKNLLMKEFSLDETAANKAFEAFFSRQRLKGKVWQNEGDALAHLIAWVEKRLPRQKAVPKSGTSDHDARMAEYERTKALRELADEVDRMRDEVLKLERWRDEAQKRRDRGQVESLTTAINELKMKLWKKQQKAS